MLSALAQRGSDMGEWLNIIIILLVVGGSMFGAIAKKLIAAFTPKESQETAKPTPVARPKPPVARKAARTEPPAAPQRRTETSGGEMPPLLAEIIEQVSGRRAERASGRRSKSTSRKSTRRPPQQRAPAPPPRPASQERMDQPLLGERLAHLHSGLENEEQEFGGGVEHRIERLKSSFDDERQMAKPAEVIRVESLLGARSPARFTPGELRRAVILSEILSPPVALRTPADRC